MVAPRLVIVQPTHGIAFWHNAVITNVQGHVDAEGVRGICSAYHKLYETYPDGIVGITVLRTSLKIGTTDTNAEAKRAISELRKKLLHVAIVIENEGVLAQLLRAVIRTLNNVARSTRLSIANDLEDAARAIAPHIKLSDSSSRQRIQQDLLEVVETLRLATPGAARQ
jgi:hypothetical protein